MFILTKLRMSLASHDAVDEVAVIGEAHPEKGEVVKAFIVLKR